MTGGRSNALYRVRRASGDDAVLRICLGDRNRFRRECALLQRFAGRLPIPRVTLADCEALPNGYFIYDYIMGSAFKVLAKTPDDESIGPAAEAAGWAIAQAGLQSPQDDARPFRADPFLEANDAENVPQFLAACAKSRIFAKRVGSETIAALARLVEAWTPQLLALTSQKALVHGDCSRSNVLVDHRTKAGTWLGSSIGNLPRRARRSSTSAISFATTAIVRRESKRDLRPGSARRAVRFPTIGRGSRGSRISRRSPEA